jgi:hypothetical protein
MYVPHHREKEIKEKREATQLVSGGARIQDWTV